MRFMMIHYPKVYATAKAGWVPNFNEMEEMGKYNDELGKAGVLLALDGLPARDDERAGDLQGRKVESHRRPVPETKEVVGGFWIIQVKSREEALEWASRIPAKDDEMVVEVRRLFDLTDFDPETQKEIQKRFGDDVANEMKL